MPVLTRGSPWTTPELKKRMHDQDILKIEAQVNLMIQVTGHLISNKEISLTKQAYYQNSFSEYTGVLERPGRLSMNFAKIWEKSVTSLKLNGVSIINLDVLSNQFNNHFPTIGPKLVSNIDFSNGNGYQKYLNDTVLSLSKHLNSSTSPTPGGNRLQVQTNIPAKIILGRNITTYQTHPSAIA